MPLGLLFEPIIFRNPLQNMHCHHGYNDNATGFCICHDGWTSRSIENLEPSTEYIHMCNVQTSRFPTLRDDPLEMVLFVVSFLILGKTKRRVNPIYQNQGNHDRW